MTNLVKITVKATDDASSWSAVKARAAKAGTEAADAFNDAFKLRADSKVTTKDKLEATGGISGDDKSLLNRLKGYAATPGGIGILGTGNDTSLMSMLKNQVRAMGQNGGPGLLSTGAGGQSATDMIRQVIEGSGPSNVTTSDFIKQIMEGVQPGNVSTSDFIRQVIEGNTPGNIETKDIIHPTVDDKDIAALGEKDGKTYGTSFAGKMKEALSGLLSKGGGGGSSGIGSLLAGGGGGGNGGAVSGALDAGGVAGGALPGIGGVSGMAATVVGLAGALVAVLPAITAVAGGLASLGGGFLILESTNKKFAADVSKTFGGIMKTLGAAAGPLVKPLEQGLTELGGFIKQIEPDLKQVFAASAPLIQPLIKGFEDLMKGAGPGFLKMIEAAGPVFKVVGSAFADLGKSLGEMFTDFSKDGGGSATILKAFLDIINSLLPFIGKLGQIFVSSLAPAFASFAGAIVKVLPALDPLLVILGKFGGAVLTDLASMLMPIGKLLIDLSPSFVLLAKAATQVFNAMENDGVFASVASALEELAKPLANLINALVKSLLPALPGIVKAFGEFATLFTGALSGIITTIATGLTAIVTAIPPSLMTILVDGIVAIVAAIKLWSIAQAILDAVMTANPIVLVVLAVGLLVGAVIELVKHWSTVAAFFEGIWNDVYGYFKTGVTQIVNWLKSAWDTIWGDIKSAWGAIEKFFEGLGNAIVSIFGGAVTWLYDHGKDIITGLWAGIKYVWNSDIAFFENIGSTIDGWFKDAVTWLYDGGKNIITGLWDGLKSIWSDVTGWFGSLSKDILSALGIASPPAWAISAGKDIAQGLGIGVSQGQHHVMSAMASLKAVAAKGGQGGGIASLMQAMAAKRGWGGQWGDLYNVEMREAGFNMFARNPNSGAYGLAQFINGPSEYAQYGGNANTAAGQITGMLNYIAQRYGSPAGAWQHELNYGWYDKGGWLPTGASIAVNTTGRPEPVGAAIGGQDIHITLELGNSFRMAGLTEQQLQDIRYTVRTKGGGNVQSALGWG